MQRREFLLSAAALPAAGATTERPHLYYTKADIARLRTHRARIAAAADRLLEARLISEDDALRGGGQHANYGAPGNQVVSMGAALGMAWQVTGEKRYAEKLREALLHYSAYQRWNGPGAETRVPRWKSELNGARFCFGFACGYDALHSFLPAEERKRIAGGMVRNGILPTLEDWVLPETRIHALDSMGHNWWAVCVSQAGVAALALMGDDARAEKWVSLVAAGLAQWFDYRGNVLQNKVANFDPDGAFYEGVGYANYALSEYLRFRLAMSNVAPHKPQPRFKQLEQATDFFLHTLYPTASSIYTLNFGDSGLRNDSSATVRLLVECGFAHPQAGWYLQRAAAVRRENAFDPFELLCKRGVAVHAPGTLPQSKIYKQIGWAMLRSSWNDDATMLAVRSGFAWNHAHADAGSFVLFHKGQPLITDSGACSYSDPLYTRYYVQARAHNVVLFNGEGEPAEDIRRGTKTPGAVHGLVDAHGVKYVYADATGPMARYFSRNYRHWLWVDGVILIFDDVLAHQAGRFDWLLHYDGKATHDDASVRIENGAAGVDVRFLHPAKLAAREEMGHPDHRPREQAPYLAFSTTEPSREAKFVVAVVPRESEAVRVEPLEAKAALGVRITRGGQSTDVYCNLEADGRRMHDNSNNTIAGWETDAYLVAFTRAQGAPLDAKTITRYFVSGASYLRKDGSVALDSLTKVERAWRPA